MPAATTARVLNIHALTTKEELETFFQSKNLSLSDSDHAISLTDSGDGNSTKIATVTFANKETFDKAFRLSASDTKLNEVSESLVFDSRFEGLTILSEGTPSQVDIVALHGLNGHAFNSWEHHNTLNDSTFMGLRDFLPRHMPGARIIIYGYNANLVSDVSTERLRDFAQTFVEKLLQMRSASQATRRPLIILAHSLGGLVVKEALLFATTKADNRFNSIMNSIVGVIFLGTPHFGINSSGVDKTSFAKILVGAVFKGSHRQDLLSDLRPSSRELFDQSNDFKELVEKHQIKIVTLTESKKMTMPEIDNSSNSLLELSIVDEKSAVLGIAGECKASLSATHIDLCKFKNSTDTLFVAKFIEEILDEVPLISTKVHADLPNLEELKTLVKVHIPRLEEIHYISLSTSDDEVESAELHPVIMLKGRTYYVITASVGDGAYIVLFTYKKKKLMGTWFKKGRINIDYRIVIELRDDRSVTFVGENSSQSAAFPLAELLEEKIRTPSSNTGSSSRPAVERPSKRRVRTGSRKPPRRGGNH